MSTILKYSFSLGLGSLVVRVHKELPESTLTAIGSIINIFSSTLSLHHHESDLFVILSTGKETPVILKKETQEYINLLALVYNLPLEKRSSNTIVIDEDRISLRKIFLNTSTLFIAHSVFTFLTQEAGVKYAQVSHNDSLIQSGIWDVKSFKEKLKIDTGSYHKMNIAMSNENLESHKKKFVLDSLSEPEKITHISLLVTSKNLLSFPKCKEDLFLYIRNGGKFEDFFTKNSLFQLVYKEIIGD